MFNNFLNVNYDSEHKIWKSEKYPYKKQTNRSVGEAFLQSMRCLDANKVLEYHYDSEREKCAKDLYCESIIVAKNLQRLGMAKGDVVLLFSGYNYMTSSLTFGTILMGGVVNFFEMQLENEDIDRLFEVIQPFMILYEQVFLPKISSSLKRHQPKSLKYIFAIDSATAPDANTELLQYSKAIDFENFQAIKIDKPALETAFLVLTSGSTGLPKVTQLSHCLLLNGVYVWWEIADNYGPLDNNSLLISLSPLRWISQVVLLLQSALLGIKRFCANRAGTGRYGLDILRKTKPTHIFSAPSVFYEILLELDEGDTESLDSLKYVHLGGEPPSSVITNLCKKFAHNSKVYYSYGMSEVSCSITNDASISGGKLQHGFEMQVLNDQLKPLGHNEWGQLAVKTPYPFLGYIGEDKSQSFLKNGFLLNGDYGYFDNENNLHLLGRLKDVIKNQNTVLTPIAVEPWIVSLPEICNACLVGYHCPKKNSIQLAALFVVLKRGVARNDLNISWRIRNALSAHLSAEQLSLIHNTYFKKSLPTNTCGKINRVALKRLAQDLAELNYE